MIPQIILYNAVSLDGCTDGFTPDTTTIPEPGTLTLIGLGVLGILLLVRKSRKR